MNLQMHDSNCNSQRTQANNYKIKQNSFLCFFFVSITKVTIIL